MNVQRLPPVNCTPRSVPVPPDRRVSTARSSSAPRKPVGPSVASWAIARATIRRTSSSGASDWLYRMQSGSVVTDRRHNCSADQSSASAAEARWAALRASFSGSRLVMARARRTRTRSNCSSSLLGSATGATPAAAQTPSSSDRRHPSSGRRRIRSLPGIRVEGRMAPSPRTPAPRTSRITKVSAWSSS